MIDCIVVELEWTPIEIPIKFKYRTVYYVKIFDYVVSRVSCICALCTHVYIVYGCTYSQLKRLRNVKLHPVKPVCLHFSTSQIKDKQDTSYRHHYRNDHDYHRTFLSLGRSGFVIASGARLRELGIWHWSYRPNFGEHVFFLFVKDWILNRHGTFWKKQTIKTVGSGLLCFFVFLCLIFDISLFPVSCCVFLTFHYHRCHRFLKIRHQELPGDFKHSHGMS